MKILSWNALLPDQEAISDSDISNNYRSSLGSTYSTHFCVGSVNKSSGWGA